MAVTSYLSSGTCIDDSGVGTMVWGAATSSPLVGTEVATDDNVVAGLQTPVSNATSHYLKCTNFGFTNGDIPPGSVINGFEIEVRETTAAAAVISTVVKFVKSDSVVGNNIGASGDWPGTETAIVYGSSTELGGTSWTQSDVVTNNFGCAISITIGSSRFLPSFAYYIDQVRIRVYYTLSSNITGVASMTGVASITM